MADELKVVKSPEITDVELPVPDHNNGIDQPFLDLSDFSGNGPWVLKTGDTMSGTLLINIDDIDDTTFSLTRVSGSFESTQVAANITNMLVEGIDPPGSVSANHIANISYGADFASRTTVHVLYDIKVNDTGS